MRREKGSIGDIMTTGLCMLAMTVMMLAYIDNAQLIYRKSEINQIARKYILRMETEGWLTEADRVSLIQELEALGVTEPDLSGTTVNQVSYGEPIVLLLRGRLEGKYEFEEKRVSTAKN